MAYELEMPNGEVITVNDDSTEPQAAFDEWQKQVYAEHGADPNMAINPDRTTAQDITARQTKEGRMSSMAAGFDAGLVNVGQQVGNMLGLKSDEDLKSAEADRAALGEAPGGTLGQFAGDTAALLPLGVIGKGARMLRPALKGAKVLTRALAHPVTVGALEGAAGGATLGGPGNRGAGAALGAGAGAGLSLLARTGARLGKEGPVKTDEAADAYIAELKKTGVKDPFLPAMNRFPRSTMPATLERIGRGLPKSEAMYNAQVAGASKDFQEAALRKAFPQVADKVAERFRASNYKEAVNYGNREVAALKGKIPQIKINQTAPSRTYVTEASAGRKAEDVTAERLAKTIRKMEPTGTARDTQLLGFAEQGENIMLPKASSSVGVRAATYEVIRGASSLLGDVLGSVPVVNKFMQPFATKGFQNWFGGNTAWQLALKKAVASKNGQNVMRTMEAMRRAYSAQAGESNEP